MKKLSRMLQMFTVFFQWRELMVIGFALVGFVLMGFRLLQGDVAAVVDAFPAWLILPLLVGMAAHWLKGYTRGTIQGSFWRWWGDNISLTIGAVVAGVGQLFGAWESGMIPVGVHWLLQFWAVFNIGYVSDSTINGQKKT